MSDDNKPKIDLKARLGKKTVSGVGPSIPPPMVGAPASIPAPPFAQPQSPSMAPPASSPNPMGGYPAPGLGGSAFPGPAFPGPAAGGFGASPSSPPPSQAPRPMAIKIDMGDEIMAAQQKQNRSKVMGVAAGTAIVGLILGYGIGGGMERRKSHNIALEGAVLLAGEVDTANQDIEKLADVLKKAKMTLQEGQFPEAQIGELGAINIPFDGTHLVGKGIGLMSNDVNRLLVQFAGATERANDQKDRLQRVLGAMREPVQELLKEKDAPKVKWGVTVSRSPLGPMASMTVLSTPFLQTSKESGYKWPSDIEVPDGAKKVKVARYEKGEPIEENPPIIPVDPSSQGAVCPADTLSRIARELGELEVTLRGDKSDPTDEQMGLIDTGNSLREKLKTVGQ